MATSVAADRASEADRGRARTPCLHSCVLSSCYRDARRLRINESARPAA